MEIRLGRLQKLMKEMGLAGILFLRPLKEGYDLWLTGRTEKEAQVSYLDKALLAVSGGDKILSIATPKLVEAGAEDPWLTHAAPGEASTPYYINCLGYYGDYFRAMLEQNHRLGLVNGSRLTVKVRNFILKYAPEAEFVDVSRQVHILKAVKSEEEISLLRSDCRNVEHAFSAMGTVLRPGVSEREAVYAIRKKLLERGANGWDYSSQCLDVKMTSSQDGGLALPEPLLYPGHILEMGDRINVKVNASMANGFSVPIGRCYILGSASEEAKKCWKLAVDVQNAAAEAMRPGVTLKEALDAGNRMLKEAGYAEDESNWIYGVGHAWSEYPMAVPGWWDVPFEEGMTLAVGPNVKPEGKDAYCCQDAYVITRDGAVRMGKKGQELEELFCIG